MVRTGRGGSRCGRGLGNLGRCRGFLGGRGAGRLAGARGHLAIAGTPEQVADTIEDWFRTGAADGFNVMPPVITQQLELFASEVVPILRKRGLFRSDYQSSTLRGHFGLPDLPVVQHKAQADAAVAA